MTKQDKLEFWKSRLAKSEAAYSGELARMERRERQYRGDRALEPLVPGERTARAVHVRNLSAELIEAQVDSSIPAPRVTACRARDEDLAREIEDMLRNELDRLPMEELNDLMERMVRIQGGAAFLLDWDSGSTSHSTVGEIVVTALHPRQLIPQDGVWDSLERADYFFVKLPQTWAGLRRRYGKRVADGRRDQGIAPCGAEGDDPSSVGCADTFPPGGRTGEALWVPVLRPGREAVPGAHTVLRPSGETDPETGAERMEVALEPTVVPWYRPGIYPVILQKNVSVYGKFLGESDLDKVADQQRTANRIESKIIDKLLRSGSYITLPDDASIRVDTEDMKVIRPGSHANKELIGVYDLQGDVQQDLVYLAQVYEEARQAIGITDSYQGRRDSTATSGRAKEFSAAQAAGRMESKRVMKQAAWAALYEAIFRFKLAYAAEPRPIAGSDGRGGTVYGTFDRWDFLERDAAGDWCWNDRFLFSCDSGSPAAGNREALWQEARMNLQTGAFGDPADPRTLVLFWTRMKALRYPLAGETLEMVKERM